MSSNDSNSNSDNNDLLATAYQAERDLNTSQAKQGSVKGDSATESGVDTAAVEGRFPGAKVVYGSAASGAGDNREMPESEGGGIKPDGQATKARDFEGLGGPEDKDELDRRTRGGDDNVNMRAARSTQ